MVHWPATDPRSAAIAPCSIRIQARSSRREASSGKTRRSATVGSTVRSRCSTAMNAAATNSAVTARRIRKLRTDTGLAGGWAASGGSRCRRQIAPAAPAQGAEHERGGGDQDRHERDVEEFEELLQVLDILPQCCLHAAQLSAGCQHVGAELRDGAYLLGRKRRFRLLGLTARQLAQPRLGFLQFALERLLLGSVTRVRFALNMLDQF